MKSFSLLRLYQFSEIDYHYYYYCYYINSVPADPVQNGGKPVQLLAKYNYKANPDRPGGFDELSITQGEKLEFCRKHPTNPHWWEARNTKGVVGFVPAIYMMVGEGMVMVIETKSWGVGEGLNYLKSGVE